MLHPARRSERSEATALDELSLDAFSLPELNDLLRDPISAPGLQPPADLRWPAPSEHCLCAQVLHSQACSAARARTGRPASRAAAARRWRRLWSPRVTPCGAQPTRLAARTAHRRL